MGMGVEVQRDELDERVHGTRTGTVNGEDRSGHEHGFEVLYGHISLCEHIPLLLGQMESAINHILRNAQRYRSIASS